MSKEQIEEMVDDLMACHAEFYENGELYTDYPDMAENMIDKGWRKQEWISVDERLPEEDTRVLVYLNIQKTDANIYTFFDTDRILNGKWVRWNKYISHWMPLPEVPKMKGGAE